MGFPLLVAIANDPSSVLSPSHVSGAPQTVSLSRQEQWAVPGIGYGRYRCLYLSVPTIPRLRVRTRYDDVATCESRLAIRTWSMLPGRFGDLGGSIYARAVCALFLCHLFPCRSFLDLWACLSGSTVSRAVSETTREDMLYCCLSEYFENLRLFSHLFSGFYQRECLSVEPLDPNPHLSGHLSQYRQYRPTCPVDSKGELAQWLSPGHHNPRPLGGGSTHGAKSTCGWWRRGFGEQ